MLFFYILFLAWGTKTATVVKLRGLFYSFFFLRGQNRNFRKVRELKLQLSQNINVQVIPFLLTANRRNVQKRSTHLTIDIFLN